MFDILQNSTIFGMVLTLIVFFISHKFYNTYKMTLLHPTVVTQILLILFLVYFGIDYEDYYRSGGNMIHFFLGPATIALALPLYRQWEVLKRNTMPILIGVIGGGFTGVFSVLLLSKVFGLDKMINLSLLPKSVTTPIAIDITAFAGGIPSITILGVMIAGATGAIIGPKVLKVFGIKNEVAQGVAMGTASHGFGTARALEEGEVQGAMAGLSIGLMGIITAIIIPLLLELLKTWM